MVKRAASDECTAARSLRCWYEPGADQASRRGQQRFVNRPWTKSESSLSLSATGSQDGTDDGRLDIRFDSGPLAQQVGGVAHRDGANKADGRWPASPGWSVPRLAATELAALLRSMRSPIPITELQRQAADRGLKDADGLTNLVAQLVGAGVASRGCRQSGGRAASIRVHGRGPLSDLLLGALHCSGARIKH